jgi:tetratricopeptide (TPR) repeat protein
MNMALDEFKHGGHLVDNVPFDHLHIKEAEDLHWIDTETQALLDSLVESLPTAQILLLVNYRPEYQHGWVSKTYYTQLRLDPLPPLSADEFLHALLGDDASLKPLAHLLMARTGGNPFFLEESVRTLVETGVLQGERGAYHLGQALQTIQVPATVQAVLAARIDRLPPEEKGLLQTAAVIGTEVPLPLLQAVAVLPEEVLRRSLTHLQATEFLYETRLFPVCEYTFKHALTHEVAYGGLLQERRRALHARIVEILEALARDRVAEQIERLAHHALRGIDLRLNLRDALQGLGQLRRITEILREAETLAETLGDVSRLGQVSLFMAGYFYQMGEHDRAIATGQRVLALATASGDVALQVGAYYYLSLVYSGQGSYQQTIDCCRWTIAALGGERRYERFGHQILPSVLSRCYLAWSLAEVGRFAEAIAVGAEGLRIAEAVAHPTTLVFANFGVGVPYLCQGAYDKALPPLERAVGICQDAGIQFHFSAAAYRLGTAYALSGRVAEALALLEQAMQRDTAMGRVGLQARTVATLGEATLLAGHLEKASDLARHALELALARKERGYQAYILRLLGETAARQDPLEIELAKHHYRQALTLAEELGMRPLQAHCHRGLGTLYATIGQQEQAHTELSAAIVLYRAMDMTFWLPQTEAVLAQVSAC